MKIGIEINSCKQCPNFVTKNQWSSDGFDRMEDWFCNKANKKIEGAVEWHEESKIKIPEWCPILTDDKVVSYVKERLAGLKSQETRLQSLINDAGSPKEHLKNWKIELTSLQFCRFEFEEILKNGAL